MDRRNLRNKATPPAPEQTRGSEEEGPPCPDCGRAQGRYGCRPVPLGRWCLMAGLTEDPARIISSVKPDPLKPLIAADPEVQAAAEELANAEAVFAKRDQEWRSACVAAIEARDQFGKQVHVVHGSDGQAHMRYPKGTSPDDQRRLEQRQDQAALFREEAHAIVVRAREALEAARRRSRALLQPPAA